MSLVGNATLLTKIYFPRLVIPISAVAGALSTSSSRWSSSSASWRPTACLRAGTSSCCRLHAARPHHVAAFGLWLAALNVLYRDIQYIIPFLIQLWMFLSPVAY